MSKDIDDRNNEFQQQVDTYVAWVNSQLKKRTTTSPVKDLRTDLSNGVLLADLVEIISGEKIENVRLNTRKYQDKQHNVSLILKFLTSKDIKVHHVTDKDIIEGNIKSIMRLILTLAAHFKPSSVGSRGSKSVAAAAANATAALSASGIHKHVSTLPAYRRHKSSTPCDRRSYTRSSPSKMLFSHISEGNRSRVSADGGSFILNKSSSSDAFVSASLSESRSKDSERTTSLNTVSLTNYDAFINSGSSCLYDTVDGISEYHDDLQSELATTKELVSVLQSLLLNGKSPDSEDGDGAEQSLALEASGINEANVIIQSQLDLCQRENNRLKNELAEVRQDYRAALASESALQARAQQQDKELVGLRQQILKLNFTHENLQQEKDCLTTEFFELKHTNQALSKDLSDKNMTIKHLRDEVGSMSSKFQKIGDENKVKLHSVQQLETQVQELRHQVNTLQRFKQSQQKTTVKNEGTIIKESLRSLRVSMPPHDSRQHILDTLSQAVKSLTDRAPATPEKTHYHPKTDFVSSQPISYSSKNRHKKEQTHKGNLTTIIYFDESNMTPVRATTPKKIGEITLKDVKSILRTSDHYRFNFKALDPEFGTVKKEVCRDDEIVPGWEGKIVAWLEKKTGNSHLL